MLKQFLLSIFCLFLVAAQTEPVVIVGSGAGSLTAAIYLARAGYTPLVIEGKLPGGLLTQSHSVQNWPGEIEINGLELMEKIQEQAVFNGARILSAELVAVDFSKRPLKLTVEMLDGSDEKREILADSCIIGMGTKPNFLGVPGEPQFWGKGVTNCAICDGALYKDKVVGVVGGGDAAILEGLYLANIAKEVHIFVRGSSLRAIEEKRVESLKELANVRFYFNTSVDSIEGENGKLTGVTLKEGHKKNFFALDGLFLAIGSTPNSQILSKHVRLDKKGYVVLSKGQETSVKGVYAMGDIVDPVYKQAVCAAGDGAKAALEAQQYLEDKASKQKKMKGKLEAKNGGAVIEITSMEHFEKTIAEDSVIVDFYATWCPPCKRLAPIFDSYARKLSGKIKFAKVNVDHFPDLTRNYDIQGMPTAILFQEGEEVERESGTESITEMLKRL